MGGAEHGSGSRHEVTSEAPPTFAWVETKSRRARKRTLVSFFGKLYGFYFLVNYMVTIFW